MRPIQAAPVSTIVQVVDQAPTETFDQFIERLENTYYPYPAGSVNITGTCMTEDLVEGMRVLYSTLKSSTKRVESIFEKKMLYGYAVMKMRCEVTGQIIGITLFRGNRWEIAGPKFVDDKLSGRSNPK